VNNVILVLKEQFQNLGIIRRVSKYEDKATYQSHYLGLLWQVLNPVIQVGIYYLVFGVAFSRGTEDGVPYIVWMLIGIIAWFFINSSILGCSNSIYFKVGMVSKMKFPVSILPSINIASNLTSYFVMFFFLLLTMLSLDIPISIYWIQYIYYFVCMIVFLFSFGILNATITVLIRDYHIMLQSILRLLFYLSGAVWDIKRFEGALPSLAKLLRMNPIFYIINGFRDSFINHTWFWEQPTLTLIFWLITMILLVFGCHLHMKFRARFMDFI